MAERSERLRDRIAHNGSLIRRALHEFSKPSHAVADFRRAHSPRPAGHDGRPARSRAHPRAERRPPHRLRQRHDGHPLRPRERAPEHAVVGHYQGEGGGPARLRRLATLSAVHRDALELVFTRPEIGTFILLSGDSDFSSLVIKLKEYGKYVIGVGIRESSSDLLVQNCDEYYSYNALAGLVKSSEDEPTRKFDPWELVSEAVTRMKRNGDVMRSDRLKQVMQEIDSTFDEKDLGMA